jgi:hypothetical protein
MNFALNQVKHKAKPLFLVSNPHPISGIRHIKLDSFSSTKQEQIYCEFKLFKNQQDHIFWLQHNNSYSQGLKEAKSTSDTGFHKRFLQKSEKEMMKYNKRHWNDLITELKLGIPYEISLLSGKMQLLLKERNLFRLWFVLGLIVPLYFMD